MNICMISQDFYPNTGGVAAHVTELSKALIAAGHDVCVVNPAIGPKHYKETLDFGIPVYRIGGGGRIRKLNTVILTLGMRRFLRRLTRQRKLDVLHWHRWREDAWFTKRQSSRIAKVFTNHSSMYLRDYENPKNYGKLRRWLGHADKVIAVSRELEAKSRILVDSDDVHYVPNGVDVRRFSPDQPDARRRANWGVEDDRPVIVCVRNLVPKTGVIHLVKALPSIRSAVSAFKLVHVGEGPECERIEQQIREDGTGDLVTMLGSQPNTEIPSILNAADIAVLPSLVEATSISGLEAMACALPLVGTRVGGIPEIIDHDRTGMLVEPANPSDLARTLVALCKDVNKRRKLGEAARRRVLDVFAWEKIASQTVAIYESVLQHRCRG